MDLVLCKNGKIKEIDKKFKFKKGEIKGILLELKSDILGNFYYLVSPKTYKILKSIKSLTLKYDFLNGRYCDPEDADFIVKNKFQYTNPRHILTKYIEIMLSEFTFNEYVWVHDAFPSYCILNQKITVKFKNNRKKKKDRIAGIMDILGIKNKPIIDKDNHLVFGDKKYKEIKSLDKWGDKDLLVQLYNNTYARMNEKLKKVSNIKVKSHLYCCNPDETDFGELSKKEALDYRFGTIRQDVNLKKLNTLKYIFEYQMHQYILAEYLQEDECLIVVDKNKVKLNNGKTIKPNHIKLYNLCFKSRSGYLNKKY